MLNKILLLSVGIITISFCAITYTADRANEKVEEKRFTTTSHSILIGICNDTPHAIKVKMVLCGTQTIQVPVKPDESSDVSIPWEYHSQWKTICCKKSKIMTVPNAMLLSVTPYLHNNYYFLYYYSSAFLKIRVRDKQQRILLHNKKIKLKEHNTYDRAQYRVYIGDGEFKCTAVNLV